MSLHIQSFIKGIDKDASVNRYPNDAAYHIENFRFITDEGLTTLSLENIKGTSLVLTMPTNYLIWGHVVLRDTLVILSINANKVGEDTTDRIYTTTINEDGTLNAITAIYTGNLGFSLANKITSVVGVYESEDIQKIYWADEVNPLKYANIADPDIATKDATWFDYIPAFDFATITINSIGIGSLQSGVVQYAYQLYNLYGSSTYFSTPTNLIPLSSSASTGVDSFFLGSDIETSSGKSVRLTLSNIDLSFNRIKIVRLFHTSTLNDPEITVIYDGVTDSSLTVIDNGTQNYGTYSLAEFTFSNYNFIPKHLASKNNILFASNLEESTWDTTYDARAYRFNNSSPTNYCEIYAEDGVSDKISFDYNQLISGTPSYYIGDYSTGVLTNGAIPETHDCFNIYNIEPSHTSNQFKYGAPVAFFGGRGINTIYGFSTELIPEYGDVTKIVNNNNHNGSTNSLIISEKVSHMRGEVYAYGVVLYNTKGQKSYVKWIGDVKFPSIYENSSFAITTLTSNTANIRNLYIYFTLNNLPVDCAAVQIVRCERKTEDRTILAQGILGATRLDTSNLFHVPLLIQSTVREYIAGTQSRSGSLSTTLDRRFLTFGSPEISYGNTIEFVSGDRIEPVYLTEVVRELIKKTNDTAAFTLYNFPFDSLNGSNVNIVCHQAALTTQAQTTSASYSIVDFKIAPYANALDSGGAINAAMQTTVNSIDYENYVRSVGIYSTQGVHGTAGIISIGSDISSFYSSDNTTTYGNKFIIANYKRYIIPYGGASYEARSRREYLPVSNIIAKSGSSASTTITKGDTYITFFEFQRVMSAGLDGVGIAVTSEFNYTIKFPVESSINTRWSSNKTFAQEYSNVNNIPTNRSATIIQENAGAYSRASGVGGGVLSLIQTKDLYSYNSVYSKQNNAVKFIPKPLDILDNVTYDVRIQYSDRKFNNENIDSWTIWRALNFKDVDSQYGPINATVNYNHDFIFFQDNGIGVASIEERELLQSTTGTTSVIGQGGILSRFDYITTAGGCQDKESIVMGRYRLYWYDRMNNSLFSFDRGEGVINISKIQGLHSFFNNIGASNITGVISGVDPKFNDIYFTIKTNATYYTVVYNEISRTFTQFVTVNADNYIGFESYLYSVGNTDSRIYLHNTGSYGNFHGTLSPSRLTLVINPRQQLINQFNIIEFLTRVIDTGTELQETFTSIRVRDSYQDTGVITLTPDDNIIRRLRNWRFNSIRDTDDFNSTFKDNYVIVDLEFTNDGNKHITISDIIMLYQESFSK